MKLQIVRMRESEGACEAGGRASILNTAELTRGRKEMETTRNEVARWCTRAVEAFADTARQVGTRPVGVKVVYPFKWIPLVRDNVTRREPGLFGREITEFWSIAYIASGDSSPYAPLLDMAEGICITQDGKAYFQGKSVTAEEAGEALARIGGYDRYRAESLINEALCGHPCVLS
jgi:hypothetical protein